MNTCKLGLHKWTYTNEKKSRSCGKCRKKEEKNAKGKWVESIPPKKPAEDPTKICQCPRDYTIAIGTTICQRCGLPRPIR
jgi:hypothetical protein